MSNDYQEMTYFQLKAECKKQNLDSTGKKPELLARLGVVDTSPALPEEDISAKLPEPEQSAPAIKTPTEEELQKFLPDATGIEPINPGKYQAWTNNERLAKLENKLSPIAAGKGRVEFLLDDEKGAYQVQFSGRPLGPISTTLIDTDQQIVKQAQFYFTARVAIGKNGQKSTI